MVDRPWTVIVRPSPDREYLGLVSYLPLRRFRMVPRFMRYAGPIAKQLDATQGLIGFSFRAKILAREFYTLSVWEDERALMDFVGAEPHQGTMGALRHQMAETKFVRWTMRGADFPPLWEDGLRRLAGG